MITNDRVQALIATDREALIELMAAAYQLGGMTGTSFDVWSDYDMRALITDVRRLVAQPGHWARSVALWNDWAAASPDTTRAATLATPDDAAGAIARSDDASGAIARSDEVTR